MMQLRRLFNSGVIVVAIPFLALACASSEPKSDFELEVDSESINIALSKEVARGLVEDLIGTEVDCDGEIDDQMRALLEELENGGPRARASYTDGEMIIDGRRRGGKLDVTIRGAGPGKIEATMPWAFGKCMLGKDTSIDEAITASIRVEVINDDGRSFSFKLR